MNGEELRRKRRIRIKFLVLLGLVVGLFLLVRSVDPGTYLSRLQDWLEGLGPAAPLVFAGVYAVAVVAAVPGSALTVIAGGLFGSAVGIAVVSIGATVGACLAFLIARYLARDAVADWLSRQPAFSKLDDLTERRGAVIVALTRLVPLFPFNLLNYGFGLTRVPFWTYAFWSWLCMLPGTAVFVLGGDTVTRAVTEGTVPWHLVGALAAAIVLVAFLVHYARGRLGGSEGGLP
jgi:uncharacterized membrane protein YdjX (TVP38/TMEM64 family)